MSVSYYADSSALLKRHVVEIGSTWIKSEFATTTNHTIYTSKLSIAEVLSGLNRRKRELSISSADYTVFSKDFLAVSKFQYELIDLSDAVLLESQRLLENFRSVQAMPSNSLRLCWQIPNSNPPNFQR